MPKARKWGDPEEEREKGVIAIMCPGCKCLHHIYTIMPTSSGAKWSFNGDFENPTFSPSLLIKTGLYAGSIFCDENDRIKYPKGKEWNDFLRASSSICHSFIKDGKIQFLNDCTHELKGKTVDLPDINKNISN